MPFHSDQGTALQTAFVLRQNQEHVFSSILGAHIVQSQLNHTGQSGATLKSTIYQDPGSERRRRFGMPLHNFLIGRVGTAGFPPMLSKMSRLAQILYPS